MIHQIDWNRNCYLLNRFRKPRDTVSNPVSIIQRHFTIQDDGAEEWANGNPIGIVRSEVHDIQDPQFYVLENTKLKN